MPETYTQEQIDEAMKFLRGITSDSETMNSSIMILLSTLSTAEQNILLHIQDHDDLMQHIAALVDIGNRHGMGKHTEWVELIAADIGYESNTRVIPMLNDALIKASRERDALKARCAELEAGLQGAADRAVAWQKKLCRADDWSCENCTECADLRTAIVGKKEE